jgi:hypothetical protein
MPATIRRLPIDNWTGGFTSLLLPVAGASFFHWLGGSLEFSVINGADPAFPSVVVGAPDVSDAYLGLKGGTSFIQTEAFDDYAGTYVVVGRSIDDNTNNATRPVLVGTSGENGTNIHVQSDVLVRTMATTEIDGVSTSHNAQLSVDDTTLFKCYMGSFNETERRTFNMTDNRSSTLQTHTGERIPGESPIYVGGGFDSRWEGRCEVACAGYWPRWLTPTERRAIYLYVKAVAGNRGLDI